MITNTPCAMLTEIQLKHMVRDLPTSDVKQLLDFANRNSIGQDRELVARALDLLKLRHPVVERKIVELHKKRFANRCTNSTPTVAPTAAVPPAVRPQPPPFIRRQPSLNPQQPSLRPQLQSLRPQLQSTESATTKVTQQEPVTTSAVSTTTVTTTTATMTITTTTRPIVVPVTAAVSDADNKTSEDVQCLPNRPIVVPVTPVVGNDAANKTKDTTTPPRPGLKRKSTGESKKRIRPLMRMFKDLPFYDVLSTLLEPTMLVAFVRKDVQDNDFRFVLTAAQQREILSSRVGGSFDVQVQLRFCVFDLKSQNDDQYPQKVFVRVNGQVCKMPVEPPPKQNAPDNAHRRPSKPVDITHLCDLSACQNGGSSTNLLFVNWVTDRIKFYNYTVAVFLVRRLNPTILLTRLHERGVTDPQVSRDIIAERLRMSEETSDVVAESGLMESLMCPIGMTRIHVPCRAETCSHVKCFDAMTYLQMNEVNPRWMCPACGQPATYNTLAIDGLFVDILNEAPDDCNYVILQADGSWTCVIDETEDGCEDPNVRSGKTSPRESDLCVIDDD